ncbi:hypothetical protein HQ590_14655 [bacterium]|nr:hypothetical protein [bacterium]
MLSTLHFDAVDHAWLWLVLVAAGAWALFGIYRGIFQRTERRLTWWLMLLRGAGLLALVLALAKPSWVRRSEVVEPGRLALVLDNSLSMSLADASGQPRYALARDALDRVRRAVEGDRDGARVEAALFDINGEPLADGPPAEPRIERTDIGRALAQTTARLRSEPLVGIVLVSDGVDNTGRGQILAAESAAVPIYAVGFREDTAASRLDLALTRVDAPKRVMVNNTIKVSVLVDKSGGPPTEATLVVRRGRDEFARQQVALPEGRVQQTVGLTMTPTEAGNFVYTATIRAPAGERLLANNQHQFPLQIDAEAIRVFYIEGFLRYEYKFLKNRLENDPEISLVSVVRRANPERAPTESGGDLITVERLKNFEVVILGDMEGDYLTPAEYRALVEWVGGGRSLLVLGGYRSFGPGGFRTTPLADVLPVVFREQAPFQSEDPFVLELTEAGRRHPVFELTGDRVHDASLWTTAPNLLGSCLVQDVKPGAEILAVNPTFLRDDRPMPVVVIQRYGAGHTMLLGVDTTWRWSRLTRVFGQSDTLFARFWSQTIRWLAGRDPEQNRPPLIVNTDRPDYEVGKPVTVRVVRQAGSDRVLPADPAAATNAVGPAPVGEVNVEVAGDDGQPVIVQMTSRSAEPDVFTGTVYPSRGGRYTITASLTAGGQVVANQAADFLVHGSELELADPRTNRSLLQSLAAASGGVYLDVEDADQLAGKINRQDRRLVRVRRTEFWNSPVLFAFFLAAVTAEWVIRRRNHLV